MQPTSAEQQAGTVFRTRDLLVHQRSRLINALRGHLAEFGMVARKEREDGSPSPTTGATSATRQPAAGIPARFLAATRLDWRPGQGSATARWVVRGCNRLSSTPPDP